MKKLLSVLILFVLLFGVSAVSEDDWLTFSEDPNNLAGEWIDTVSERATLSVFYDEFAENGNPYSVIISWANSAFETYEWFFTGTFEDIDDGCIVSTDCVKTIIRFSEDEEMEFALETVYENGVCRLTLLDGLLYWQDHSENAGKDCAFERLDETAFTFDGEGFGDWE